ncbi:MAG: glycosyltransferase family 4 protein [Bacteroidales bacterium]
MRILMLNYEYPPVGGGAGVISRHIAEGLAGKGHDVHVLTGYYKGCEVSSVKNKVQITRLASKRKYLYKSNPYEMLSWIRMAKKFLRQHLAKHRYDLCFAHFALPGGEVAYSMKLKYDMDYVVMSHGHDIPWFFPKQMLFYHMFTYGWIKQIVIKSKALFVQSDDMEKNAALFLGKRYKHLLHQIPNGWDTAYFYPDETKRSENFEIVFPGRLVKQKDPFSLLKAIELIKDRIPGLHLRVLGDGPMRTSMEKWVKRHNMTKFVSFEGWQETQTMRDAYQSAWMVVLPSLNEGMSMATMEAIACGTYVIVTDVSRNAQLIEPGVNGDLVPPQDVKALAGKIKSFYDDKFRKAYKIPASAIDKLDDTYSWDTVVSLYDDVLEKI